MLYFILYFIAILLAIFISVVLLPDPYAMYRPDMFLLYLIWINCVSSCKHKLLKSWLIGLLVNVVTLVPLGCVALLYLCLSYFVMVCKEKIMLNHFWQNELLVMFVMLCAHLFMFYCIGIGLSIKAAVISSFITYCFWFGYSIFRNSLNTKIIY